MATLCVMCNIDTGDDAVICGYLCRDSYCGTCSGIGGTRCRSIASLKAEHFFWRCPRCIKIPNHVGDILSNMQQSLEKLTLTVKDMHLSMNSRSSSSMTYCSIATQTDGIKVANKQTQYTSDTVKPLPSVPAGTIGSVDKRSRKRRVRTRKLNEPDRLPHRSAVMDSAVGATHTSAASSSWTIVGKKSTNVSDELVAVTPLKWLYVSRLHPSTDCNNLNNFVSRNLGIGVDKLGGAIRLLKKDVDVSKLRTVSFKIGVPAEHLDKCLCDKFWTSGVLVREFVSKNRAPVLLQ